MYTLPMSWSFRALVFGVVMALGLAPQLACFMPENTATEAERDCCEKMANDCGGTNMSHECCRTAVRSDVGIATKVVRNVMPHFDVAARTAQTGSVLCLTFSPQFLIETSHAPPGKAGVSFLTLRI
jgi:hypothetical protein